MAWTNDDLTAIRSAIMRLVTGAQRVTVSFSTTAGSRTVTYKSADLKELRALEQQISEALATTTSGKSRTVLTRSRKGL
jgi:hypothetical protein